MTLSSFLRVQPHWYQLEILILLVHRGHNNFRVFFFASIQSFLILYWIETKNLSLFHRSIIDFSSVFFLVTSKKISDYLLRSAFFYHSSWTEFHSFSFSTIFIQQINQNDFDILIKIPLSFLQLSDQWATPFKRKTKVEDMSTPSRTSFRANVPSSYSEISANTIEPSLQTIFEDANLSTSSAYQ